MMGPDGVGDELPGVFREFAVIGPQVDTVKRTGLLEMYEGGLGVSPGGLQ
jgi:hypothetical protein